MMHSLRNSLVLLMLSAAPVAAAVDSAAQSDAVLAQVKATLQMAIALRAAQAQLHTTLTAAADPLVPQEAAPTVRASPAAPFASSTDLVLPPVPTVGVSPVVQWLMGVAYAIITFAVPTLLFILKQHFSVQAVATRAAMINGAVTRGAADLLEQQQKGIEPHLAMGEALTYVKNSYPDAVKATGQATDEHLAVSITKEAARLKRESTASSPTVVVTAPLAVAKTIEPNRG